ncbi:hydroxymethylglutaryl-CoA lyase, mitochondrial-like [Panonychus citri]|uniref:hydroxymethylglutaryl-CoA lyase, mitochondrial-like n=1 Tax=Panonychus citri TaxID=50023 RepID=UPI002306DE2B|nr:hydroxymethylglutaryl-CoA lyase, mitochondrial-like [Panonychus citri]
MVSLTLSKLFTRGLSNLRLYPASVKVVEVGPRDGLQNEKTIIDTSIKVELINRLNQCGLKVIEVTSFVSPKWVPQMSDNKQVYGQITKRNDVSYPVLVPNLNGLKDAINSGVKEIALFMAATESFSKKNTNCTIEESFIRIEEIMKLALKEGLNVRGYISCVIGCPYEGPVDPEKVTQLSKRLYELGCYEISLGDTIGIGNPGTFEKLLDKITRQIPIDCIAVHCHDTYGMALANIYAALQFGISTFDSSISGLGGCPYAPGATGNVATEDLVYMLHGMGIETGINFDDLMKTSSFISSTLNRQPASRVFKALNVKEKVN